MVSLYPIQSFKVEMTIIQGRNLIGKDRRLIGGKTSDPYVVASLGMDVRLGQTKTCFKTLNPQWDATFHFSVPNKRHAHVPTNMSTFVRHKAGDHDAAAAANNNGTIEACSMVLLKIYDQDEITDDDLMGTLIIPIPVAPRSGCQSTMWYDVDNLFVHNATGQVQVALTVTPERATTSDRSPLNFPSPEKIARWTASVFGKKPEPNEHNVIVESDATDRKNYVLAILKQLTT